MVGCENSQPHSERCSDSGLKQRQQKVHFIFPVRLILGACLTSAACAFPLPSSPGPLPSGSTSRATQRLGASGQGMKQSSPLQVQCAMGTAGAADPESRRSGISRRRMFEEMAAGAMVTSHLARSSRMIPQISENTSPSTASPARFEIISLVTNKLDHEIAFWTRALGMTVHADATSLLVSFCPCPKDTELALRLEEGEAGRQAIEPNMLDVQLPFRPRLVEDIEMTGGRVISSCPGEFLVSSPSGQQVRIQQQQASFVISPTMHLAVA